MSRVLRNFGFWICDFGLKQIGNSIQNPKYKIQNCQLTALLALAALLVSATPAAAQQKAAKVSPDDPRVKAAIQRGVGFLRRRAAEETIPYAALMAMASLKAGVPASSPEIQSVL